VTKIINPTFRPSIVFTTRTRSQQMKPLQIDAKMLPQMAKLLLDAATSDTIDAQNLSFLTQAGIVIEPDDVPQEVRPRFPLSPSLLDLIPHKFRVDVPDRNLRFDRENVYVQTAMRRPDAHAPGIPPWTGFPNELPLVWVFDPRTEMWAAYHTDTTEIEDLDRELLHYARILVDDASPVAPIEPVADGVAVLREVISPLQIAAARAYARGLEREGYLQIDEQKRFFKHNDELFRFLHRQTGYLLRRITGEMIIPSYTYLSVYREDAELERHVDRPQCIWNASLLIDTTRDDDDGRTWPIYLETTQGTREVRLDLGDAVVYRGAEVPHWRPKAAEGERQTLVLMHYVPFDFTGSLD